MESEVIRANIAVHTRMADAYNSEPHFRAENQQKVRAILLELRKKCGGGKMLDVGCGTGFIIHLAKGIFDEIHGVDVTQAMMDKIDRSGANITLHNTPAEKLPFPDKTFDLVTAYSFLHHTEDSDKILREASRVLKPGGICYADLEPNKLFWQTMENLAPGDGTPFSPMLKKARDSVTQTDANVQKEFGIPKDQFNQAEYGKSILGGVDAREIARRSKELGFASCSVRYEWFLGQGDVMHGQSFEDAAKIEAYLRAIAPVSDALFKYVQLTFVK